MVEARKPDPDFDPWLDDSFAQIDLRKGPGDFAQQLTKIANSGDPDVPVLVDEVEAPPAPAAVPEPVPVVSELTGDEPEVYTYEDGSSITVDKIPTGLRATLSIGGGSGNEVFYGKDENELLRQVLSAKLNASKKIRQQNKQLKLTVPARAPEPVRITEEPVTHELSVDEKFEIKTKLADDPDLAFQDWFQKKTGMSVEALASLAQEGRAASDAVTMDTEARAFKEAHPTYAATGANFQLLMGYLAKDKLNVELKPGNEDEVMNTLVRNDLFTRQALAEAFDTLSQDGLLELLPVEEDKPEEEDNTATPVPAPPKPVVSAAPPSGLPGKRSPRAANVSLGIRPSTVSGVAPDANFDKAPSVDELENMSTDDIGNLLAGVRRLKARTRR